MEAVSAAEQIEAFLGSPAGSPANAPAPAPAMTGRIVRAPSVAFRDVSFSYAAVPVLEGFSLSVSAGERLALTGASGAGKSTILALLNRFARPQGGAIEIDGLPIDGFGETEWRRCVAWLPQRPTIFHGSVRDNVRLGRQEASEKEIRAAMARARLEEIGLDTPVGEGGQGLSAGQVQRVAIARLFLRSPLLVLLDEPTAHLDEENAALVSSSLEELSAGRTTILVTHRAESASGMDRMVEIRDAKAGAAR
jgi:ABC-type multidrug transport system fused ATPase/permease subunit